VEIVYNQQHTTEPMRKGRRGEDGLNNEREPDIKRRYKLNFVERKKI